MRPVVSGTCRTTSTASLRHSVLRGAARVRAVGWSMGGGILQPLLLGHPEDLASLLLVAPVSPYGFGCTVDAQALAFPDAASSGGGGAAPEFVRRPAEEGHVRGGPDLQPASHPPQLLRAGANAANVDEDFLLAEALTTRVGDDFYHGDSARRKLAHDLARHRACSTRVTQALQHLRHRHEHRRYPDHVDPRHRGPRLQRPVDVRLRHPRRARRGARWPGADLLPQPMKAQLRAVLDGYAPRPGQ